MKEITIQKYLFSTRPTSISPLSHRNDQIHTERKRAREAQEQQALPDYNDILIFTLIEFMMNINGKPKSTY